MVTSPPSRNVRQVTVLTCGGDEHLRRVSSTVIASSDKERFNVGSDFFNLGSDSALDFFMLGFIRILPVASYRPL